MDRPSFAKQLFLGDFRWILSIRIQRLRPPRLVGYSIIWRVAVTPNPLSAGAYAGRLNLAEAWSMVCAVLLPRWGVSGSRTDGPPR